MQEESKKAESQVSKGKEERLGPGGIDEYKFFMAQDEEAVEECIPEEKGKKRKGKAGTRA